MAQMADAIIRYLLAEVGFASIVVLITLPPENWSWETFYVEFEAVESCSLNSKGGRGQACLPKALRYVPTEACPIRIPAVKKGVQHVSALPRILPLVLPRVFPLID